MKIDMRKFLIDFSDSYNLNCIFIDEKISNITDFDLGFRNDFFKSNQYKDVESLFDDLTVDKLLLLEDQFLINYIIFVLPESVKEGSERYCVLGPYASRNWDDALNEININKAISEIQIELIEEFYLALPRLVEVELFIMALSKLLYYASGEKNNVSLEHKHVMWQEISNEFKTNKVGSEYLNAQEVLNRYRQEAIMLDYVQKGDYDGVMSILSYFTNVKVLTRYRGNIHSAKTALNTLNTLCRITLQKTAVHPVHIDNLSTDMANLISSCTSENQLTTLNEVIVREYCDLVLKESLSEYPPMIREVINYIDFNLSENLSLSFISKKLNLDSKSLTSKFTVEVGMRLTQYINEKRIDESLKYLTNSNYSIQSIAGKVGFMDDNYYRRVFKNIMKITPTQYRKTHKIDTIF